ncbi:uncharacterized protein [Atheta coriaria]|uniref:uncharacterized protein n=1 Tax=Dalotia coriaria TaxID=877792 RepID=UPI0031F4082B
MYKLFILSIILATSYAAPGHLGYGHHDDHSHTQLIAIKPVAQHNAWNPWQQNNGWNPWQQNNGWNPWQKNSGWNPWQQNQGWNPWQQNNAWNPWNQGYGSGGHHHQAHVVKVPVHHAPATSYAQVTSYNVHHVQPVVKAIVPTYAHDYGYGHGGHGYHH